MNNLFGTSLRGICRQAVTLNASVASSKLLGRCVSHSPNLGDSRFLSTLKRIHPSPFQEISHKHSIRSASNLAVDNSSDADDSSLKIVKAFYGRINDIYSFSQSGSTPLVNSTAYFQMIPNGIPINLSDYVSNPPRSPFTPRGDLRTTEEFANIASMSFDAGGKLTGTSVEKAYDVIIKTAKSGNAFDENAINTLKKVQAYLYVKTADPLGVTGEVSSPSPEYLKYLSASDDYAAALTAYQTVWSNLDFTKLADQRKWEVESIMLQANINRAKNNLELVSPTVERALTYLKSYGQDAVQYAISTAKENFDNSEMISLVDNKSKFHLAYGIPDNWYNNFTGFTALSVNQDTLSKSDIQTYKNYGGGTSFNFGLFSLGASFDREEASVRRKSTTEKVEWSFKIATVAIQRPGLDPTLFSLNKWYLDGQPAGKISSGNSKDVNGKILPYYSTALVIAKEVSFKGNWTSSDMNYLQSATKVGGNVGYGPFTLSGHYTSKYSKTDFNSYFENGTLKIPGAQIVGVINTIVPMAPPDASS